MSDPVSYTNTSDTHITQRLVNATFDNPCILDFVMVSAS